MKALVPCAGFGRRLGELCRDRPKPLLDVGDGTIVEHILANLASQGCTDVWINVHHRAEQFPARLGDGSRWGVGIHWLLEDAPLGTAGTVASLREHAGDEPLLVHYGDVLTDHDIGGLFAAHARLAEHGAWATILVHQRVGSNSVAMLGDGDRIDAFVERPTAPVSPGPGEPWVFSGICVLSPAAMASIPEARPADLPAHVFPVLAERGRLFGQRLAGFRCAVDSAERLELARRAVASGAFVPAARRCP